MNHSQLKIRDKPLDINDPKVVEILIRRDGRTAWINVNGICLLRASDIRKIIILDHRPNHAAKELGRKGGKKRARRLSKKRLSQIGKQAAAARWNGGTEK